MAKDKRLKPDCPLVKQLCDQVKDMILIPICLDGKKGIRPYAGRTKTDLAGLAIHSDPERYGIGALVGPRRPKGTNYMVVDLHKLKPKDIEAENACGLTTFKKLRKQFPDLETFVVKTPSGGFHYYFEYDADLHWATKVNNTTIDMITGGHYIVAPPSKGYTVYEDYPIATIPPSLKKWLLKDSRVSGEKLLKKKAICKVKGSTKAKLIKKTGPTYKFSYSEADLWTFLDSLP